MSDDKKIVLNMNEDNEISFGLSIEGYSSDPSLAKSPTIRFALTEEKDKMGFILPAKFEDGQVSIKIPSSSVYKEGRSYSGTLEVFLGNRYFKPAEIDIEFQKPLDVKANLVNEAVSTEVKRVRPSEVTVKTTSRPRPAQKPRPAPRPVVTEKLSVADEIERLMKEEEMLLKMIEKVKKQKQTGKPLTESEQKIKERLKRLFREG